jgi:small subunit ribosomal protein S19
LTRGITDDKRKLLEDTKLAKAGKRKTTIKTHLRDVIILPYMAGLTISVYSGKEFLPFEVKPEMVGHYLGEFIMTNKRVVHGAPGVGASRSSLYVPLK